jgi:DNA polymerase-4
MQQAMPELRGKPVGVIPFEIADASRTCVIACSKEAKARGVKNVMRVQDVRQICPEIVLVSQRPDLFRRAHNALLSEIACEIPIETVKSIDELACTLDVNAARNPLELSRKIKQRLARNIGSHITCSIGFAANRLLAKTACKMDKPDGTTIWHPDDMPGQLLKLPISEISGIGKGMERRLNMAGVANMKSLLATQPKQLRKIWGNVNGERMWYALHGYDIKAMPTGRGMYGHGRVLPPEWRNLKMAEECSRLLLTKAARRMRRDGFSARKLWMWLQVSGRSYSDGIEIPSANDDHAVLSALLMLWQRLGQVLNRRAYVLRLGVTLGDLVPADERQLDFFLNDDVIRQKWERITSVIDYLNSKFGKRVLTLGSWTPPPGGFAGGKISFTRIPSAEDFW